MKLKEVPPTKITLDQDYTKFSKNPGIKNLEVETKCNIETKNDKIISKKF